MSSMVRELQASLTNPQNDILASLRSAHIIASKLKLVEIDKWILQELNGYTNVNAESIPKYRVVKGRLMAMNPVNGWIPVQFSDDAFADILKTKYIGVSMSELVTLCNSLKEPLIKAYAASAEPFPFPFCQRFEVSGSKSDK